MHMRMLNRKLKNRPRKLRPVRRCFRSTFTACRSLNRDFKQIATAGANTAAGSKFPPK